MEWTSQSVLLGHSGRSRSLLWRRHAFCLWALTQTRGIRTVRYYTCGCCTESVTRAKIHQTSPVQWLPVSLPPLSKTWGLPCGPVVRTSAATAEGTSSITSVGTKILRALWPPAQPKIKKEWFWSQSRVAWEFQEPRDFKWRMPSCTSLSSSIDGVIENIM